VHTWEQAVQSLIDDPSKGDLVRACYFDPPLLQAAQRYASSQEWTQVRVQIGSIRGRAADIGAGNGIVSFALAQDGFEVVSVEPDPSDLVGAGAIRSVAAQSSLPIEVRAGVGEALPLEDNEVDLILVRQVLHHAKDLEQFCKEIARCVKSGGVVITLRDHVVSGPEQMQAFFDAHPLHSTYGGENAFTRDAYRAALTRAGLKIQREIGPLESVINFAPLSLDDLRNEIAKRLGFLGAVARFALASDAIMRMVLPILSRLDRRPGRLVSYVCRKP
jgi:SAM-dependent methyltransferase